MTTGLSAVEKLPSSPSVPHPRPKGLLYPWLILALAFAALDWYVAPQSLGVDGIGYIDTALAYARGDWHTAINTYWSPLYCWVLALFLRIVPTSISSELPLVHAVNALCFLFAFWTFHRFWSALKSGSVDDMEHASIAVLTPRLYDAFGYSLFLYLFVPLIRAVTADVLASGFIFLLAYEVLHWRRRRECGLRRACLFGVLIAFAFFAKAVLLYFGLMAIGCVLFDRSLHRRLKTGALAGSMLVLLLLPWAASLRWATGEWSLGSSGKLNYAWFVDGAPTGVFQDPNGPPSAFFPGQRIRSDMKAFVVPVLDRVTYVPWYDPGRLDHRKPTFVLRAQLQAIAKNLKWLRVWFFVEFAAILFILFAFAFINGRRWFRELAQYYSVLVPCLAVLGMYTLIFVRSYRYIAAIALLLFGIALVSAVPRIDARRYVVSIMMSGLCLFWVTNVPGTLKAILQTPSDSQNSLAAAQQLQQVLPANSAIAVIGEGGYAYWAHLARLRVVGEIWHDDLAAFWNMPCTDRRQVLATMHGAGAMAAVGVEPGNHAQEGWHPLGNTGLSILALSGDADLHCPLGRP